MSVLLYDPDCGFCSRCADFAQTYLKLDAAVQPGIADELVANKIARDRFADAIPFVLDNKQVAYGALAIGLALKTSRSTAIRWAGAVIINPLIRPVAEKIYALISKNRYRMPGATGTCNLPR